MDRGKTGRGLTMWKLQSKVCEGNLWAIMNSDWFERSEIMTLWATRLFRRRRMPDYVVVFRMNIPFTSTSGTEHLNLIYLFTRLEGWNALELGVLARIVIHNTVFLVHNGINCVVPKVR